MILSFYKYTCFKYNNINIIIKSVATLGVAPQHFEGEGFIKTTRRLQLIIFKTIINIRILLVAYMSVAVEETNITASSCELSRLASIT